MRRAPASRAQGHGLRKRRLRDFRRQQYHRRARERPGHGQHVLRIQQAGRAGVYRDAVFARRIGQYDRAGRMFARFGEQARLHALPRKQRRAVVGVRVPPHRGGKRHPGAQPAAATA